MNPPVAPLHLSFTAILAALCILPSGWGAAPGVASDGTRAVKLIETALKTSPQPAEAARQNYAEAVKKVLPLTVANVAVTDTLRNATVKAGKLTDDADAVKVLRAALLDARETLTFKPRMEAKLPQGFPPLTPVGEVQIKNYPTYRLARTAMKKNENSAFWTLFKHIQSHEIAMTAPVEMTYGAKADAAPGRTSMAFLYQSKKIGKVGQDGDVEVVDLPAATAVSIGVRGDVTESAVTQARKRLEVWLAAHKSEYSADGPVRVMGYNSPFVPAGRRYSEVQIPVRKVPRKD